MSETSDLNNNRARMAKIAAILRESPENQGST